MCVITLNDDQAMINYTKSIVNELCIHTMLVIGGRDPALAGPARRAPVSITVACRARGQRGDQFVKKSGADDSALAGLSVLIPAYCNLNR